MNEGSAAERMINSIARRSNLRAGQTKDSSRIGDKRDQAVWKVDSDQPMWKVRTQESLIDRSVANKRFLMGVFAALALALTIIGLYGVMSYAVSQRTQEIGVRMALGAGGGAIRRMALRQGMTLVFIGVVIGLASAWLLTRLIANLLFSVSATDPLTFASIPLLLAIVALLACWIPARRATRVDPIVALNRIISVSRPSYWR